MTVLNKTMFEEATFDVVRAEDTWKVTIVQDEKRKGVELEYSAFLEPYLIINQKGSELELGISQTLNLPSLTVLKATVYVQSLREVSLKETALAEIQGTFTGEEFRMSLEDVATLCGGNYFGNLQMTLDEASIVVDFSCEGARCSLSAQDASVFKGTLTASESMEIEVAEASRVTTYGGSTPSARVQVKEAGFLNMVETEVASMALHVSSASEASVHVNTLLEGNASDNSTVFLKGCPTITLVCDETSIIYSL